MLATHRAHRSRRPARGSLAFLLLAALAMLLAGCALGPGVEHGSSATSPGGGMPGYRLSACGKTAPLTTETGLPPAAPTSFYLGNVGYLGHLGPYGSLGQRLFALDPATGATRWCDQFTILRAYTCPPTASCPAPPIADIGQPLLLGNVLYACVAWSGQYLYAIDAATGLPRWDVDADCGLTGPYGGMAAPPHAGTLIYSGHEALDAGTGAVTWSSSLPLAIEAASGTQVYGVATTDATTIYALDARTGALRWQQQVAQPLGMAPIVAGGMLYVGEAQPVGGTATFYSLDTTSGQIRWHETLATEAAAVGNGLVYVSAAQGLLALDAATGATRWSFPVGSDSAPLFSGSVVYVGTGEGITALNAASGAILWRWNPGFAAERAGPPVLAAGIIVSDVSGNIGPQGSTAWVVFGLDAATGGMRWQRADIGQISPPSAG